MYRFKDSLISVAGIMMVLLGLLSVTASTNFLAESPIPPNMIGVWQGFYQNHPTDPQIPPDPQAPVLSEVTSQENRRVNGVMLVGVIVPCTLTFNGTVAGSDRVNLQGQHEDHHGVAKLDLHDFGGGAAILKGELNDGTVHEGSFSMTLG